MRRHRWPKKREFLTYYYIFKTYGCGDNISVEDLVDELISVFRYSRRTSINIIKRLIKINYLLKGEKPFTVRPRCLNEILDEQLRSFITTRHRTNKR